MVIDEQSAYLATNSTRSTPEIHSDSSFGGSEQVKYNIELMIFEAQALHFG